MTIKKTLVRITNTVIWFWTQTKKNSKNHIKYMRSTKQHDRCNELNNLLSEIPKDDEGLNIWTQKTAYLVDKTILSELSKRQLSFFLAGILAYIKNESVTPSISQQAFVDAYEETNGACQEIVHNILFAQHKKVREANTKPYSNNINKDTLTLGLNTKTKVLSALREDGYAVLPTRLNSNFIEKIQSAVSEMNFTNGVDRTGPVSLIRPDQPPADCNVCHAVRTDLYNNGIIESLSRDELFISCIEEYLGSNVKVIDRNLWYTFPAKTASSEAAQLFHYDLDTMRWIKVFIYLSDVKEENGPHEYVKGTHKIGKKHPKLLLRSYSRLTDKEVDKYYKNKRTKLLGKAGTIILADTRCYHKGNNAKNGFRLMLEYTYAPSSLGFNFS